MLAVPAIRFTSLQDPTQLAQWARQLVDDLNRGWRGLASARDSVRVVTNANVSVLPTDGLVSITTGNISRTATLPSPQAGQSVILIKNDAGSGTIVVSTVVGGNPTITANQGRGAIFESDGTAWFMVGSNL